MNFRTEIQLPPAPFKLTYKDQVAFIGSCFSENISSRLSDLKMKVNCNPFGIVFNSISIQKNLLRLIEKRNYTSPELFKGSQFYSFDHHSSFSDFDVENCLRKINQSMEEGHAFLKQSKVLFITLGSAYAYWYKERNEVVANCHKLPQSVFQKKLSKVEEIVNGFSELIMQLQFFNPELKIVFTVSPVRHLKDGMIENQRSKAILLESVHQIVEAFNNVNYFPAYEIAMDDLRDYRFYGKDMLHLNEVGIDYVFQKFSELYFELDTLQIMHEVQSHNKFMNHRSLSGEDISDQKKKASDQLYLKYPFLQQ